MAYDQRPPLLERVVAAIVDIALALLLALVMVVAAAEPGPAGADEPLAVSLVAAFAMTLPLALRRRRPVGVLVFVVLASIVSVVSRVLPVNGAVVTYLAIALALHPAAASLSRSRAVLALVGSLAGINAAVAMSVTTFPGLSWTEAAVIFGGLSLVTIAAWSTGRAGRARRLYHERLADRALTDERLRIARDLHDGIAHSLSLITVQASVANHVAAERPEEARSALAVIESTGREALRELRRMLGVLRTPEEDGAAAVGAEQASLQPSPTADRLAELAEQATRAGVEVDLRVEGVEGLPAPVGLSVYRIVQESLTNVVKHAAPARCQVRVSVDEREVEVEVIDDGNRAPSGLPGGHGLIGMRERVSLFSGEFSAGRMPGGGFRVHATMPLESVPA